MTINSTMQNNAAELNRQHRLRWIVFLAVAAAGMTGWIAGCCGYSIGGCSTCVPQIHRERTEQLSVPLAQEAALTLATERGSIRVTGEPRTDCAVTAKIKAWAETAEKADELTAGVEIRPQHRGKNVTLEIHKPCLSPCQGVTVDLEIQTPQRTNLKCQTSRGNLQVAHIQGDLQAQASRGSIICKSITGRSITLSASRGSITLTDTAAIGEKVCVNSTRGPVEISQLHCERLDAAASRGPITISQVQVHRISATASRGNITGEHIVCDHLEANASRGNIRMKYAPEATNDAFAKMSASRGSIDVTLPQGFAGEVDLSSMRGSVRTDRPLTIRGKIDSSHIKGAIGQGRGKLQARTSRGNIHIR